MKITATLYLDHAGCVPTVRLLCAIFLTWQMRNFHARELRDFLVVFSVFSVR